MASSKLELLRSAFESVENSEKVLAIAYQNRKKFLSKVGSTSAEVAAEDGAANKEAATANDVIVSSSKAVWWDMLIGDLTATMHRKSKEIVQIYEDVDGSLKAEQALLSGEKAAATVKDDGQETAGEGDGTSAEAPSIWDNFYSKLEEIDVSDA